MKKKNKVNKKKFTRWIIVFIIIFAALGLYGALAIHLRTIEINKTFKLGNDFSLDIVDAKTDDNNLYLDIKITNNTEDYYTADQIVQVEGSQRITEENGATYISDFNNLQDNKFADDNRKTLSGYVNPNSSKDLDLKYQLYESTTPVKLSFKSNSSEEIILNINLETDEVSIKEI